MKADIYTKEGKKKEEITLPESVFGLPWNNSVVSQVVIAIESNERKGTAHTKSRAEVSGGGKKPWRQKGTGRARHGSTRSPIWRGGGITFGPRTEKDYSKKVNKKMKSKALAIALSRKLKDGEMIFLEGFSFNEPKTSGAKMSMNSIAGIKGFETILSKRKNSALIALGEKNENIEKSFRNFSNMRIEETRNLNARDILKYKLVIVSDAKKSVEDLENRIGKDISKKESNKEIPEKKLSKTAPIKKDAVKKKTAPKKTVKKS